MVLLGSIREKYNITGENFPFTIAPILLLRLRRLWRRRMRGPFHANNQKCRLITGRGMSVSQMSREIFPSNA